MKAGHGRTQLDVDIADIARRYADLGVRHWQTLLILLAVGWLLFSATGYLQDTLLGWRPQDLLTFFDLDVIPVAFLTAATAHSVLWESPGAGPVAALDVAWRAFLSLLAVTLLVRAAVVVGIMFLVLPGLAAIVFLGLAAVIMMAERPGIIASLRQSAEMVLSAVVKVLGAYIIFILSLVAVMFVMLLVAGFASAGFPEPLAGHIMDGAFSAGFSISYTVFAVAIYQVLTEARHAQPTVH
ncbi:MAG: YciC family protein [Pseudomonadota bacterium]